MIVFHGVAPESIFLSTFTEKAAKQLQDGLVSLLGLASEQTGKPYDLSGMYVGTVHALCHRLLQDRSLVVDRERSSAPAVLDELDQYFTLAQGSFWSAAKALLAFEGELPAFRETVNAHFEPPASASRHKAVVNLQSLFNRLSEEDLDPKDILEKAPEEYASLFRLYQLYRDRLGKNRVDLSLLQRAAYRALLANDGTMHRFKHVIVDEYQDTNAIQERIFFRLAGGSKNVCVVGDDDQALYRFRGATVENFVEFPKRCVGALGVEPRRIELGINYRSRRGIVQAYTSFVTRARLVPPWRRPVPPARQGRPRPQHRRRHLGRGDRAEQAGRPRRRDRVPVPTARRREGGRRPEPNRIPLPDAQEHHRRALRGGTRPRRPARLCAARQALPRGR